MVPEDLIALLALEQPDWTSQYYCAQLFRKCLLLDLPTLQRKSTVQAAEDIVTFVCCMVCIPPSQFLNIFSYVLHPIYLERVKGRVYKELLGDSMPHLNFTWVKKPKDWWHSPVGLHTPTSQETGQQPRLPITLLLLRSLMVLWKMSRC